MSARTYIGISGWVFSEWRGSFYPESVTQKEELSYASQQFTSLEINSTFYRFQTIQTFLKWYHATPSAFKFSVKGPQHISHVLRLKNCERSLANFLASGVLELKEKLGPILWQFPKFVTLKDDRFDVFFKLLPKTFQEAEQFIKVHLGQQSPRVKFNGRLQYAFEFRHKSFLEPTFIDLMKKNNLAFVMSHAGAKESPYFEQPTANFVYVRLHGEGKSYQRGYSKRQLERWANNIKGWQNMSLDTYLYFSNEAKKYSPLGAVRLLEILGTSIKPPRPPKANRRQQD